MLCLLYKAENQHATMTEPPVPSSSFPAERPSDWTLTHLVFRNLLAPGGEVHRLVEVTLNASIDQLSQYTWRVPLSKESQSKIYGLSIKDSSNNTLRYKITYLDASGEEVEKAKSVSARIDIFFDALQKGRTKTIQIEYFVKDFADLKRSGLLKSTWRIDWKYHVHSHMEKFEYRISMPHRSKITHGGIDSSMSDDPLHFSFDEKEIVVWMEDNPPKGELKGSLTYEQETPTANFLTSLASGTVIAAMVTVVSGTHDPWRIAAIFGVSILGMAIAFFATSRLLPSAR